MSYAGDIRLGDTIDIQFTTRAFATGIPTALAGSPVISAYVDNSTTEITAGITLTVSLDSVVGLNNVRVVASSGNGFATATNVSLVITTGTVDGVSVVGECIGSFSIEHRSALMPTTAARTLDVTATGAAGIDWGNVENPTTALNLSGTNIDTDQVVASVTGAVGSVTGNVGGTINGFTVPALAQFFLTDSGETFADAIAGSIVYEIANNAGGGADPWAVALPGAYAAGEAGYILGTNLNALITSRMATYAQPTGFLAATFPGTVASTTNITAGTITTVTNVTNISANGIGATSFSTGALTDIENAVWDATMADHLDAGSTGFSLNAAGSAGDPWLTPLPGAYAVGTAGYLLGTNLDAPVSAIPADVLAELQGDIIPVNVKQVNDINVIGSGTTVDPWNPEP